MHKPGDAQTLRDARAWAAVRSVHTSSFNALLTWSKAASVHCQCVHIPDFSRGKMSLFQRCSHPIINQMACTWVGCRWWRPSTSPRSHVDGSRLATVIKIFSCLCSLFLCCGCTAISGFTHIFCAPACLVSGSGSGSVAPGAPMRPCPQALSCFHASMGPCSHGLSCACSLGAGPLPRRRKRMKMKHLLPSLCCALPRPTGQGQQQPKLVRKVILWC